MNRLLQIITTVATLLLVYSSPCQSAPPSITAAFPSGGQIGQTTEVSLEGKLGSGPFTFWSDNPQLTATFPADADKAFQLSISEEAAPGVATFRVINADGPSSLRPFIIGRLPEIREAEPNESLQDALPITSQSVVVNGRLGKNGDVDTVALDLEKGATFLASLTAHQYLGSPMDGVLQLVSADGFILAQNDDDSGMDPLLTFNVPETGKYYLRLFGFPATPNSSIRFSGGADWVYRLTLSTQAFINHMQPVVVQTGTEITLKPVGWNLTSDAFPVVAAETGPSFFHQPPATANLLFLRTVPHPVFLESAFRATSKTEIPFSISANIDQPGETDTFAFFVTKGQPIQLNVEAQSLGSFLDPVLTLTDAEGKQLIQNDDAGRDQYDSKLSYTPKADGEINIRITDRFRHAGNRYFYLLTVTPPPTSFRLNVEQDAFQLVKDKPLEIPITVDRDAACQENISMKVEGLPSEFVCEPVVSQPKGDTAKKVVLKISTAQQTDFSGPFTIVASVESPAGRPIQAVTNISGTSRSSPHFWLTAKPEK